LENSNYVYGGRNVLQPYVPSGSVCLAEVEMYMYYVPRTFLLHLIIISVLSRTDFLFHPFFFPSFFFLLSRSA
jgi:hypothetical protein